MSTKQELLLDEKYRLAGSLLEFTQIFYKLRTGRLFEIIEPPARECHFYSIAKELTKVMDGKRDRILINIPPRYGKAVDSNTPILTSSGWKTASKIVEGDYLLGSKDWTRVTGVFPQGVLPAKKVIFSDGQSVICNGKHLWSVRDRYTDRWKVKTTDEIQCSLNEADQRKHWRIPLVHHDYVGKDAYNDNEIDPYLLGCWLGDGHSHTAAITTMDEEIVQAFVNAGHTMKPHKHQNGGKAITYQIINNGFQTELRINNQLKNKHFPDDAYRWLPEDRYALLQGLMDTDGTCGKNGQISFTNKNPGLIKGIAYLVASLGGTYRKYTRKCGTVTLNIRLPHQFNPFRLKRKAALVPKTERTIPTRLIADIEDSKPCEMVCFTVDADDHLFAVGEGLILTHNTELLINFVAWALAIYPDSNFLYVSYSHSLSQKQTQTIRQIMQLRQYQDLFGVQLSEATSAKDNFETTRGGSVYGVGTGGTITGRGAGLKGVDRFGGAILFDDLHKPDEVTSDTMRKSVIDWYYNTLQSRTNDSKTPIIGIGQRLHENDIFGHLIETGEWHVLSLPALDHAENPLYPTMHDRYALKNMEKANPYVFASQYQQNPQPAGGGIFKPEWFYIMDEDPEIIATFITADTAETDKSYNDATVFSFWGLYKIENTGEYALHWLDCREIRVEPKDLEDEFMEFYQKCTHYPVKPLLAIIEKKSTGVTLISTLSKIRGLHVKALDRTVRSGSKTQRFLDMQPLIAAKLVSFTENAKHKDMCIEHMRKITANNSHRFDDICDSAEIAVSAALIDKHVKVFLSSDRKNKDSKTAKNIMSNFMKVQKIRKERNG